MKTKTLLFLLFLFPIAISAQDLVISFTCSDASPIDSISAENLRSGESITFPGNEELILSSGTGVELSDTDQLSAIVFPNPSAGQATITMWIPEQQDIVISVRNQLGQLICQNQIPVQGGNHSFALSLRSAGIYSVQISYHKNNEVFQVVSTSNTSSGNNIHYLGHSLHGNLQSSRKSGSNTNTLPYVLGDMIRYTCYSGFHTTVFQEMPREIKDYNYTVEFYPCIDNAGKGYSVVKIGEQLWMAENLAWLPSVSNSNDESTVDPYYYVYAYEGSNVSEAKQTDNYSTYGVLYNYPASIIACPEGWHLPSDDEFKVLEEFLGMSMDDIARIEFRLSGNVGRKLKSTSGWINDGNGTNNYGFNLLPGGLRWHEGYFEYIGDWVGLWTSSVNINLNTMFWCRGADAANDGFLRDDALRDFGYSVRFIKDD